MQYAKIYKFDEINFGKYNSVYVLNNKVVLLIQNNSINVYNEKKLYKKKIHIYLYNFILFYYLIKI